ncbi:ATP-binding cassette domain-containing protein [Peribacillus castrilensis]|jgi:ABC-2 type transport system ATP-binding protein|uniref:ATP-binding cassette domain-containing protein n=1 Tax=Peribacillus frigoritolerans TaxID=450367 RepID=A0AAJ1VCZ0_9BACI|nr:ATP-binding cassette domain-containing protein [Peribacillus frigoritolerans]TDL86010.1 ATP-binding cassette domain-containing protein [Vibrio vulnificus]MDM5286334.1 ATP-binding cassette domain-containing protein [Peribacillus frigoritolerans]USK64257.1 ATP-binding cassette domain-containing protein [Peribacillus frigoritolerans]UZD46201.1 ATP-binding cassette domain-containing protein [Peribacillus frigoritolerans]WHX61227.1 ATP-binding cassette domain-containing protein [Peribacillus fri
MSESVLKVQSLTKKIGKATIVDNVSFEIKSNEIFGLLGPNGAGKTTIIRMITGLINRTGGTVMINGSDLDHDFEGAMNELGAIVENPEFYKYMTGRKNILHYARMSSNDISNERIEEVIKLVKLDHAIDKKVKTYSLGMRQRLGVAQAILHKPSLLIFDEPTNGLDPQGIREFRDYLKVLASEGVGILISSHLLSEMQLMCDSFAVIEKGKLIHTKEHIVDEKTETINEVSFTVSDGKLAKKILQEQFADITILKNGAKKISVSATREQTAHINRSFNANDLDVFEIGITRKSLEDKFFEITEQEMRESV